MKVKKVLALALVLSMCLGLLPTVALGAESQSKPQMFYYDTLDVERKIAEIGGLVPEYNNYQGSLYIPSKTNLTLEKKEYNGTYYYYANYDVQGDEYAVTRIDDFAYHYCAETAKLTSVIIEEGITEIGDCAFYGCEALNSITLPESLAKIGSSAFLDCYALESIHIPAGVTELGHAWQYSNDPEDCYGCNTAFMVDVHGYDDTRSHLREISVSKDNANYASHDGVLYNKDMTELICCPAGKEGPYVIPDGVSKIWPAAFLGCKSLTDLTIPASVTELPCTMLYWHPNGAGDPVEIGLFSLCDLTSVTILNPMLELTDYEWLGGISLDSDGFLFPGLKTIYGYNGSTAETYAAEHGITFVSLGDAPAQPSTAPSAKPSAAPVAVTGVSVAKTASVQVGKTKTLTATVTPRNAENKSVYWTSDDTYVVSVDTDGTITGVKTGTANVTVTTVDGGFTATCAVTVTKASSGGGGGSSGGGGGGAAGGGGGGGGAAKPSATPSAKPTIDTSKPASENFSDVVKDSWYEASVTYVVQKGLFNGVAQGQFAPQQNMTRAMLVTVLARLDGQDTPGGATWYAKGTDWAKAQGVSDGTMLDQSVTREQMVTMLYRYAKAQAGTADLSAFADGATVSDWAKDAMAWAVSKGILTGKDGSRLDPQGTATRAEVATILQRFVEKK